MAKKFLASERLLLESVEQCAFSSMARNRYESPSGWHRVPKCRDGSRPPVRKGLKKRKRR